MVELIFAVIGAVVLLGAVIIEVVTGVDRLIHTTRGYKEANTAYWKLRDLQEVVTWCGGYFPILKDVYSYVSTEGSKPAIGDFRERLKKEYNNNVPRDGGKHHGVKTEDNTRMIPQDLEAGD